MRLPGTEQWSSEGISKRISFERNVASAALLLMAEIAAGNDISNAEAASQSLPSDAIYALGRAAELAFANDDVLLGLEICREMLSQESAAPKTPSQFAFYVTVGALLGAFTVYLAPAGVVAQRGEKQQLVMRWPTDSSPQTAWLMRHLSPAALASGPVFLTLGELLKRHPSETIKPSAMAAYFSSPEYEAISEWLVSERPLVAHRMTGLATIEDNYMRRLTLMQSDTSYWRAMRPKGSIVDWPLLSFWVAVRRFPDAAPPWEQLPAESAYAEFIRSLASDLARHTAERGRPFPDFTPH